MTKAGGNKQDLEEKFGGMRNFTIIQRMPRFDKKTARNFENIYLPMTKLPI